LADYHIGTSGWHYADWRGRFYPEKLPMTQWLEFYAGHFSTVELNNSFYRLPTVNAFAGWREAVTAGFTFAVKVSRFITHIKRLKGVEEPMESFISRARNLNEKLGPLLYQLPPNLHRNDDLLESFLRTLPGGMKHVIEFRHQSWLDDEVFAVLRRHNIGLCIFDMPALRCPLAATTDFAYIRFHGSGSLYSGCYPDEELADWAGSIAQLADGLKEVYIYFNNDVAGYAVRNAFTLRDYLQKQ